MSKIQQPISETTTENIDSIHDMILQDRRIRLSQITETLPIFQKRTFHVIYSLNADQKPVRVTMSKIMWRRFQDFSSFLYSIFTMDETYIDHYDPETK